MQEQKINYIEVLNKQVTDFSNMAISIKDRCDELENLIKKQKEINKKLDKEHEDAIQKNYNIELLKKDADKKFADANTLEAVCQQKVKQLETEIKRAEQRNKEMNVTEASLNSQKNDLIVRETAYNDSMKWLRLEERALKATRYEIDKLIKDNKLQEYFKGKI